MGKFTEITSKENKVIKYVSKLQKSSKFRFSERKIVIEGLRISEDVFENNASVYCLIVNNTFAQKFSDKVTAFADKAQNNYQISDALFERISDTETPQGILLVVDMPLENYEIDPYKKYIALDNLQDPSNFGAITRTCEALGVGGIIMNNTTCDPFSPKSIRASMGTILRMPIFMTDNLSSFLKENNLKSFSCVVDSDAMPISSIQFKSGDVIIIGNEANGISKQVKDNSDFKITIPMSGRAESLNAAAAAAIAIYELTK